MQIILSQQCESLTGSLGRGFGYVIVKRGNRFFSQRGNRNVFVPPDGHWRFILTCAQLAQNRLHIADVKVTNRELFEALREANLPSPAFLNWNNVEIYNASDILNLKSTFGL